MTSISTIQAARPIKQPMLLHRTLLGNVIFSTLSALIFLLWAKPIAHFVGLTTPLPLTVMGVGLLVFAVAIVKIVRRVPIDQQAAFTIFIADVVWVVGSGLILLLGWPPLSVGGKWAVVIVADIVAAFAVLEYLGLRQLRQANVTGTFTPKVSQQV